MPSSPPADDLADQDTELEAQVRELEDRLQRSAADLDNARKRFAREVGRARERERARVAAEWLPVVDHLDMALQHAHLEPSAIVSGVQAVRDQAVSVLEQLGFPRRDDVGERFDPQDHHAVSAVSDPDAPPGTVLHVVRPGYGRGEYQLRPASVVVSTGSE